jgi:ketosteroid isomerase-like protein
MPNDELVRSSFDAFLRGDWDKLSEVMDAGVHWLGYEPGGCDCHGRKQVLATLFDRRREGVVTGLNAVVAVDERVFVEVTGPRLTEWGPPGGQACMVVTVRDGRIVRMQDYPDRAAARAGAGLPPDPSADGSEAADELSVFPPLHWAASSDDVEALDALLDAGADIEADGAVIGGGTAIADAVAFGQWNAARRLLERGARTTLWQAAALGLLDRVQHELEQASPSREDLDNALWCAAHGGQREAAELLLARGADPTWVGHDNLTAAAAAERSGAHKLATSLRERAGDDTP